ncbi:TonB-dependent receptor [Novosphingobium profundi]|uniref:TonB-dependent receptor n=1 Tax=Novosphingobium profundi TaxID=1774954 RepID=UPI001BDB1BF1|nr:TonB-dependent receptor [Novosphingobium profundi]MBT0671648.1 TonB-dependent receptor [Novosphingobium profundi]
MNRYTKYRHLSSIALATSLLYAAPAFAQASADEVRTAPGEIVVTARKTGEDILKTPVTVTAMTSDMLDQRGIVSMTDVVEATPGISINNSSSGHADRSFQQVVLRGMTPSSTLATTVSTFIDGVPVSSPSQVNAVSNPERVEILKGPQSAYFGRNTFAGAINVVTKVPGNEWGGELLGMIGTRDNWRLRGSVEGPIIEDLLSFRIAGEKTSKSGSWKNQDGITLGDESTTVGSAMLAITPSPDVTIKLFGMLTEDKDGPAAQTRLYAYDVPGAGIEGQSNCTLTGDTRGVLDPTTGESLGTAIARPFFCGTIPKIANPVTANVTTTDAIRSYLADSTGRVVNPEDGVHGYGLARHTEHAHATFDWNVTPALTASVLAGYNHETWSTFIDLDGYDSSALGWGMNYLIERKIEDWSVEGRLAYDMGPFRAVGGVSYLNADMYSGLAGYPAFGTAGGLSRNKTTGFFFGLTYDLTDTLSVSGEGRYQIDQLEAYANGAGQTIVSSAFLPAGYYAPNSLLASSKYKNFTPRIIVNWNITPDMMAYASWSKGVNPAAFNTSILSNSATVQQAALDAGGQLAIKPEKLTNYEVGLKGRTFGGQMSYTVAAYYAQWRDQINAVTIVAPDATQPTGYSFVNTSANSGSVDLYGIEGELNWYATDFLTINAAGAINETDIQSFTSTTVSQLTGVFDFSGNEMKNTSKYSANVGIQFGTDIKGWDEGSWFVRGDWNFKSGMWSNEANIAKSPDMHFFNARAGISHGNISLEAFVTNIFNNKTPISISDNYTLTPTFAYAAAYSALNLGLPDLRTAGLQAKIKF